MLLCVTSDSERGLIEPTRVTHLRVVEDEVTQDDEVELSVLY
jgi:hypothetical protein